MGKEPRNWAKRVPRLVMELRGLKEGTGKEVWGKKVGTNRKEKPRK